MKTKFILSVLALTATFTAHAADSGYSYKGACMVYSKKGRLADAPNLDLSRKAQVLYKNNGYSFEVEQVDLNFPQEGGRVVHSLELRIMKGNVLIADSMSEVPTTKGSGMIMMIKGFPTISCSESL